MDAGAMSMNIVLLSDHLSKKSWTVINYLQGVAIVSFLGKCEFGVFPRDHNLIIND